MKAKIQRFIDRLRGLDWDDLEPHDRECPYCEAQTYRTPGGPPWRIRCKECGATGSGNRRNENGEWPSREST